MVDLVYFGGPYEAGAESLEKEFKESLINVFPSAKTKDAYDDIKGYRQEVSISGENKSDYYAWIIAEGWSDCSLNLSLIRFGGEKDELMKYLLLAKENYPENFK